LNALPGESRPVLGTNWPAGAVVSIKWPDGTEIGNAGVQSNGQFATQIRIPQSAQSGMTYKITATGGGLTATAEVVIAVVYSPSFTLNNTAPPRAGTSVPYSGRGWPPNTNYEIRFSGTTVAGGTTTSAGDLPSGSTFIVPQGTKPGTYTVTAVSGGYSVSAQLTTQ
jgi:large repetitive protein